MEPTNSGRRSSVERPEAGQPRSVTWSGTGRLSRADHGRLRLSEACWMIPQGGPSGPRSPGKGRTWLRYCCSTTRTV
jgi:hypothetical protein